MTAAYLWAWDTINEVWVKVKTDDQGRLYTVAVIDELDDIGDVYVPTPTDLYILYWNNTNSRWECRAFTDWLHASAHEDGGDDEISIAGLLGESAELTTHKGLASVHHTKTVDASELSAGLLPHARYATTVVTAGIIFIIDGGGSAITTGEKGHLLIPFDCTIYEAWLLADQSGSIVIDIWKDTYANFPPTNADSITSAAPPTISTAQKYNDASLISWVKDIDAEDILAFNVDSCTTITRVTLALRVVKRW